MQLCVPPLVLHQSPLPVFTSFTSLFLPIKAELVLCLKDS